MKTTPIQKLKKTSPFQLYKEIWYCYLIRKEIEELRALFNNGSYQKYQEISIKEIDYTFIQK